MKKLFAMLLAAALLVSCFSACGSSAASSAASSASEASQAEASAPVEEASEAEAAEPVAEVTEPEAEASVVEEASAAEEIVEPENYFVSDDTLTVSVLYKYVSFFVNYWEDSSWETSPWWDALEEATNVNFEFTMLSQDVFNEQTLLLINSGSLPDLCPELGNIYTSGLSGAVNDEVIYDLSDYLEEYAPHYWKLLNEDGEDTIRDTVMDDGAVAAMYGLYNEPSVITSGLWIRDDYLDALDLEVPTTLEDLKTVLAAFKSEYDIEAPMYSMIGRNTIAVEMAGVDTAFGSPIGFYTYEGDVHCSYIEDSYYQYISYLKDLAEDGLFITSDVTEKEQNELMASGAIGVYDEKTANIADQIAKIEDENASYKAMTAPGEPSECGASSSLVHQFYYSISTNCENPELIVKMFDYLFTEEGSMLASYGIEGLSYDYDAEGTPHWTDLVTNNPDGAPYAGTSTYYLNPGFPALQVANIDQSEFTEDYQKEASDIWAKGFSGNAKQELDVSLTADESTEVNATLSDINTYLTETVYAWIFGGAALDEDSWNAYLDTMESMNISGIIENYQAAYDRYQQRSL